MADYLDICEQAARAGGQVLLDWQDRFAVREKAPADLVTDADLASQRRVREILLGAFPGHGFLGEEGAGDSPDGRPDSPYRWIVDPLDGTTNYVHGVPIYCVSIALEESGRIVVATVYNPVSQQCFTAAEGQGAYLNGDRLKTSDVTCLADALVAVSFGNKADRNSSEVARFVEVLPTCQAIRRFGSAALNLCMLAAGRIDVYWATSTQTWDMAAGLLLVQEAGGVITRIDGSPVDLADPRFAAAATEPLHQELLERLARAVER
jgi:myo-inositol-1(or 4)-monophosphatase